MTIRANRASSDHFHDWPAKLTDTIIDELTKTGLSPGKILSQVYDSASLMSGKHGGVQKHLQQKLHRDIPYVHCFNHQLHLVVIHALATEQAFLDFSPCATQCVSISNKICYTCRCQGLGGDLVVTLCSFNGSAQLKRIFLSAPFPYFSPPGVCWLRIL